MKFPFSRDKQHEPTLAEQMAYAQEGSRAVDYEPSGDVVRNLTYDEKVLERLLADPFLQDVVPAIVPSIDTNFNDSKGCKLLSLRIQKAIKYIKLGMPRSQRRENLGYMKMVEANVLGRVNNNRGGRKIKSLLTFRKQIVTSEGAKEKAD